ncbi:MAG TPA: DNA primase [Solirubrobacteraceae bacterium]
MALYTDDSIERLRQAVDMADLVGAKTELRRSGQQLMGCCPFHDERTPSFSVDPDRKVFHCFGCGEGGDLFKFVELTEGLRFREAVEHLADRYGVQLELTEEDPRAAERRKERDRLLELLERTASWYVRLLWESDEAADSRRYLLERGLDEQQLREFRVGYAPSAWDGVLLASRRNGFSEQELYDAGLVRRGKNGQLYDYFRRRITFPLCDARGRVLGFGGRAVGADQQPKYVNSTDNIVYHKGRHLFGSDLARAAAAKAGQVVLCEGYTDVIALHQAGLRNTVGLMGTALTDEQVTELARLAPVVVLALDADGAGQEAMLRAAKVASGRRLELRVVSLPEGSDPADVVASEGGKGMRERVAASVPFIRFRVERELARGDLSGAEGKDLVVDALKPVFADLPPSAMRDELTELVAEQVGVGATKLSEWLAQPRRVQPPASRAQEPGPETPVHAAPPPRSLTTQVVGPSARIERAFLIQCIALPAEGRVALTQIDIDEDLTVPAYRRAAVLLRDATVEEAPQAPGDDEELGRVLAELHVRARQATPSRAALEAERLRLQVERLERAINVSKHAGSGDLSQLVARREQLRAEVERKVEETLAQSRGVE